MLKVAQRWNWTNNKKLSPVNIDYSIKLGINASPQYEFRIHIKGLREIYKIAGPLINSHKNKCINFHVNRSENYINIGGKNRFNNSKEKILMHLKENQNSTTTDLQFITNTGTDVVLRHLHNLENNKLIIKRRGGKRYIWNIK
jgi:predicted transcriptional regulator